MRKFRYASQKLQRDSGKSPIWEKINVKAKQDGSKSPNSWVALGKSTCLLKPWSPYS